MCSFKHRSRQHRRRTLRKSEVRARRQPSSDNRISYPTISGLPGSQQYQPVEERGEKTECSQEETDQSHWSGWKESTLLLNQEHQDGDNIHAVTDNTGDTQWVRCYMLHQCRGGWQSIQKIFAQKTVWPCSYRRVRTEFVGQLLDTVAEGTQMLPSRWS